MKKIKKLLPVLILLVLALIVWILGFTKSQPPSTTTNTPSPVTVSISSDEAFRNALNLYIQKKAEGVDMTNGPCLGKIADDWVLDIAHNPRQPDDDKAENQCEDFRSDNVKHFIELDPEGKLIKSQ